LGHRSGNIQAREHERVWEGHVIVENWIMTAGAGIDVVTNHVIVTVITYCEQGIISTTIVVTIPYKSTWLI
jgi:hypothetical protein